MRKQTVGLMTFFAAAALASAQSPGIAVDKDKRTVTIDAKVAPRKINDERYKEIYPIEVIASWPFRKEPPGGQKAHETVVTIDFGIKPSDVHKALETIGLKPGAPVVGDVKEPGKGPDLNIYLLVPDEGGEMKRIPIERALIDRKTGKAMPKIRWRFTGSAQKQRDPTKDVKEYGADVTGTLITIFPVTADTVFQTHLTMKEEKFVKLETDKKVLPAEGTSVKLVLEAAP